MIESKENELEYEELAKTLKDKGNEAYQSGDNESAILFYSQAIGLDPDNHILFSNRSAAYLKGDFKSKALYDAEKCVAISPDWSKGYSRLGAAQQALKRFDEAINSFKKSIELDPNNQSLQDALRNCEESYELDKKAKFAAGAIERAKEEEKQNAKYESKVRGQESTNNKKSEVVNEDDLLSSFFNEISDKPTVNKSEVVDSANNEDLLTGFFADIENNGAARDESVLTPKYTNQDLGDGKEQIERLTAPNFRWRNLNPYHVFQLDVDATEEDIKYRYKKLSLKVHPDKQLDIENARTAFEEVKLAYQKLMDPDQKKSIVANVEYIRREVIKDRKKLISKGMNESELEDLESEINKKIMHQFADIEMSRIRSERNLRSYNVRDKYSEDKMKEQLIRDREFEKEWIEGDRHDKRVSSWREFQSIPEAKKAKIKSYQEEKNVKPKVVSTVKKRVF
eukprot:gene17097-22610_t